LDGNGMREHKRIVAENKYPKQVRQSPKAKV
jgi:hypothetical protein